MIDKLKKARPSQIYFYLCFLGYVLTPFFSGFRTGVFSSLLMLAVFAEAGMLFLKSDNKKEYVSVINICVLAYFVLNVFSFIWILINKYPLSVYAEEFTCSILPIVFYAFAICALAVTGREQGIDKVYKGFLYAFALLSLASLIFYIIAPQFYCDYLFRISYISKADASTVRVRMEGVTGSTSLSYLGVAAMLVAAKFMYETFGKNKKQFIINLLLFLFALVIVFMANGRAGMVAALLVICYLNVLVFFLFKYLDKKYFYYEIGLIIVLIAIMCIVSPQVVMKVWARLISLPGAIGQRSEQWVAAVNNMNGQWFGNGLGANGHKAIYVEGAHPIPDGGLVKLYCEEGAIGFTLYLFIMIKIFKNGIKNLKKCFCELGIIATALLISIGSNVIAFQLCMPIFWFAAGVCAAEDAREPSDGI